MSENHEQPSFDSGRSILLLYTGLSQVYDLQAKLILGNSYEARQTSKEQTKMSRFMLEGP